MDNREYTPMGITGSVISRYMPGIDLPGSWGSFSIHFSLCPFLLTSAVYLPGGDYNVTNVQYTDPHICQSACDNDPKCVSWTYVTRPPLVGALLTAEADETCNVAKQLSPLISAFRLLLPEKRRAG